MNRIVSFASACPNYRIADRQKAESVVNVSSDSVRFGHKHSGCQHDHGVTDKDKTDSKFNARFQKAVQTVTGWFKLNQSEHHHEHGEHCTHDHHHEGTWMQRTTTAMREWCVRAWQHVREDLYRTHEWLKKKFPNLVKPPRV